MDNKERKWIRRKTMDNKEKMDKKEKGYLILVILHNTNEIRYREFLTR